MAASFHVITGPIGERGHKKEIEVRRIQQLLARSKMLGTSGQCFLRPEDVTGQWSDATKKAVLNFKEFCNVPKNELTSDLQSSDKYNVVFTLCQRAGVLLKTPFPLIGANALQHFFDHAKDEKIPYAWHHNNRVAHGLAGHPAYLIFTNDKAQDFDVNLTHSPRAFNCISFTNLALSIWRKGNASDPHYLPSQAGGGFGDPIGRRYGLGFVPNRPQLMLPTLIESLRREAKFLEDFPRDFTSHNTGKGSDAFIPELDNYFYDAEEVFSAIDPSQLYYLQWCYGGDEWYYDRDAKKKRRRITGFGHHDTVLYAGDVYEWNTPAGPARTALKQRWNPKEVARLMGPV